jgi:hypothetical protein
VTLENEMPVATVGCAFFARLRPLQVRCFADSALSRNAAEAFYFAFSDAMRAEEVQV